MSWFWVNWDLVSSASDSICSEREPSVLEVACWFWRLMEEGVGGWRVGERGLPSFGEFISEGFCRVF